MLMLSEIRRFRLVDDQNQTVRIADLSVDLLNGEYPPIKQVLFWNDDRKFVGLDWKNSNLIDLRKKEIRTTNLKEAKEFPDDSLTREVLLVRDVLDALILDLQNRRVTRANDLWLEKRDEQIVLSHADISTAAILRRLSFNLWRRIDRKNLFDWKFVEFLRGDPNAVRNGAGYHLRITKLAPGEIAGFIDLIPYLHAAELIVLLPDKLAADVLELTSSDKQLQIFEELDDEQSRKMFALLAPETGAKIIKQLKEDEAQKALENLPKDCAAKILELLRFPEGTVGSVMTNDVVTLPLDLTVDEARQFLTEPLKNPNFVYFIYVVETGVSRVLRGVISLRRIVTAEPTDKVADIMDEFVSVLSPMGEARAASFRLIDSHLAAMPVVDETNKLLGVLTIDAAVSNVAPRNWRDQAPRVFS
ncbi:MAG: CBS domain-containing protein [Pyrinomonadaceae bacterium]